LLTNAEVRHNVNVQEGARLSARGVEIGNNLQAEGSESVQIFTLRAGPPNTVGNNILLAGGSEFVAVCNIQVGRNVLIQEWTARGIVVGGDAVGIIICTMFGGGNQIGGSIRVLDNVIGPLGLEVHRNNVDHNVEPAGFHGNLESVCGNRAAESSVLRASEHCGSALLASSASRLSARVGGPRVAGAIPRGGTMVAGSGVRPRRRLPGGCGA
jgi:hypothetical protein